MKMFIQFLMAIALYLFSGYELKAQQTQSGNTVFSAAEKMPEFPGGTEQLYRFIAKNIKYPAELREKKIEGKVITSFIVRSTGKITDLEIIRSPDSLFSKETLRVLSAMPDWIPGKQNGKEVDVKFVLPVRFQLN